MTDVERQILTDALKLKVLVTGIVIGLIAGWIFPLVTGVGCIQ
jgi:hypothetical protein